jgi:membrane fusion protein, multidrug efflux system
MSQAITASDARLEAPGAASEPVLRDATSTQAGPAQGGRAPRRGSRRRLLLPLIALAAIVIAVTYGWDWFTHGRFMVSTDDAYVQADMATIAAKVGGYVESVAVQENQSVKAGDLLARIDDGDYRLAVDAAQTRIATQDATIGRIGQQMKAQEAGVAQAQAQVVAAGADAARAASDYDRAMRLSKTGFASQQSLDLATADRDRTRAALASAQAALRAAQANTAVLQAQQVEAERQRAELEVALDKAKRDLSFTEVRAPFDGVVGNRAVQRGMFVQPGTRLLALVPLQSAYVEANFKETQLAGLRPGQPVSITVDSLGGRTFEGTVASFAPASGSEFSLLPPENATGNFTKIVQRVPVRIRVPAHVAAQGMLRPGLSVVVDVDTRDPSRPAPTIMGALAKIIP